MVTRLIALILMLCLNFSSSGIAPVILNALAAFDGQHEIVISLDSGGLRMTLHHSHDAGPVHQHGWGTDLAIILSGATTEHDHVAHFKKSLTISNDCDARKALLAFRDTCPFSDSYSIELPMLSLPGGAVVQTRLSSLETKSSHRSPPHLGTASQARLI